MAERAGAGRGRTRAMGVGARSAFLALALAAGCYSTDPNAPEGLFDDGSATAGTRSDGDFVSGPGQADVASPTLPSFGSAAPMPAPPMVLPTPSVTPTAPPPPPSDPNTTDPVEEDAGVEVGPLDHDLGTPCDPTAPEKCQWDFCYVPGATDNPICTKLCADNSECPSDAECVFPGNCGGAQNDCGGLGFCFVRCDSDAFCTAINDTAVNPLECVTHPKYDFSDAAVNICIESSEP